MIMDNNLLIMGNYNQLFNDMLNINIKHDVIYRSKGLPSHMLKSRHEKCLKYIDYIPEIIENPDYIGINPNEKGQTIELVKRYGGNVLIGIKVDKNNDYLYVSTMYDISEAKLQRRLYSGRLKEFAIDTVKR